MKKHTKKECESKKAEIQAVMDELSAAGYSITMKRSGWHILYINGERIELISDDTKLYTLAADGGVVWPTYESSPYGIVATKVENLLRPTYDEYHVDIREGKVMTVTSEKDYSWALARRSLAGGTR